MNNTQQGFSLVEALLALGLFSLVITATVGAWLYGQEDTAIAGNRARAVMLAEEGLEAVRNIQDSDFDNIGSLGDGMYSLSIASNMWNLASNPTSSTIGIFTRSIDLLAVTADTKEVTSRITWQQNAKRTGLVSLVTRFTNWLVSTWTQTTQEEFNRGFFNSTESTSVSGGEVQLEIEGDWTDPTHYHLEDLSGGTNGEELFLRNANELWFARANSGEPEVYLFDLKDISNVTSSMSTISTYELGYTATGMHVGSSTAYFSTTSGGNDLAMLNLSTTTVTTTNIPGGADATDVFVAPNGKVLISKLEEGSEAEFYVYDSTGATELGIVEVGSDVNAVVADSSYAYLATADGDELWIVDYNTCTGGSGGDECIVTEYNPSSGGGSDATALHLVGTTLYMGRANNQLHSFDVSSAPTITESLDVDPGNDEVTDLFADEDTGYLYVTTDDGGSEELSVITISDGSDVEVDLDGGDDANSVVAYGRFVYVASNDGDEIQILEASTGGISQLEAKDSYDAAGGDNGNDIFVSGDYAYLATDDDLWVFDISDPTDITLEDTIDFNFDINDVYVSGNYAYLATDSNSQELTVVDVSDPSNISEVETLDLNSNSNALGIWVSGTTAYVTTANNGGSAGSCTNSELYIIDITNPLSVSCSGSYDVTATAWDVTVSGNYAYLATEDGGREFLVLDISTPASITEADSADIGISYGVYKTGDIVYLASVDDGTTADFYIYDVTTPTAVTQTAAYDTGDTNRAVYVSGSYAYLATDENDEGLTILDISTPASIPQVSAYDTAGDCNGVYYDGTNAHVACEDVEYFIIGASSSATNYAFDGWFTSEEHDTGSSAIVYKKILWNESGTGEIQFQLRTAPDSNGSPGTWTSWLGPATSSDYYDDPLGGDTINSTHSDGSNDQWIQYRGYFSTTNASSTPVLEDISITFQ